MRHACQATEAAVYVRLSLGGVEVAFEYGLHQQDATTRRVHFAFEFLVGWTGGQAESAVDTGPHGRCHRVATWPKLFRVDLMKHARPRARCCELVHLCAKRTSLHHLHICVPDVAERSLAAVF